LLTSLSKAQLVTDGKTSALLDSFLLNLNDIIQKIAPNILDMQSAVLELKNNISFYDAKAKDQAILLQQMQALNINRDEDVHRKMEVLSARFESTHELMDKLMIERNSLLEKEKDVKIKYSQDLFRLVSGIGESSLEAFCAIRKNLVILSQRRIRKPNWKKLRR
jgi:hypothetical protein